MTRRAIGTEARWRPAVLFFEAAVHLAAARLAASLLSFACVTRLVIRPPVPRRGRGNSGDENAVCANVIRVAVCSAARWPFPWASCLHQALAAHWMLRWRGISSRICFGVKRGPDGLCSHAWLVNGNEILLGGESASEFSLLAEFPAQDWTDNRVGDLGNMAARR